MINRESLLSLEAYARERDAFRAQVMEHKKRRSVHLGEHVTLHFEDELTIRYQVQEMLRIERIFEEEGIQDELEAYNPLVPDGANWKATMLIEYPDESERAHARAAEGHRAQGVGAGGRLRARVYAIADEDLERENDEKTSSVHFLRFELDRRDARSACASGARAHDGRRSSGIPGKRDRCRPRCARRSRGTSR